MKIIDNFKLPEHTNKLYKEESISSISLTREVANKINELVNAYNELSQEDLEWKHEQEGRIRKGVLYMKDNLLNSLNDLMVTLRDSGFIDDRIEFHCDTLKTQLNNLLGSVKVGTTTMDAEIIDARIGANGEEWATIGNAIRGQIKNRAITCTTVVNDENYETILPDVNAIDEPCSYQLNFVRGSTNIPANLPYTTFNSNVDELITFKDHYYRQVLIGNEYVYTRYGVKTTDGVEYFGWNTIYNKQITESKYNSFYKSKGIIDSYGYAVNLPDANKILENSIYQLNFNYGSTEITANLPYKTFTGRIDELITFADKYYRQLLIGDKYIYTRNGILSSTRDSVDYGEWILIWSPTTAKEKTFTVSKNGGGDYTSLTKCVFDNLGSKNVIHVKAGTYDLITEFKEYFGDNIFDKTTLSQHGLPVQNGTKFIMDSGAVISFMYDSSNSVVEEYFSPFIMKGDSGEIHGGKIVCANCRYAIHDDVYDASTNSISIIEGVHISYNSARNVGIGGGFGQSSHITVKNCIIENGSETVGYGIFYHNSATGNSQSFATIENNYVDDKIVIESYGTSTNVSNALVTNNKCYDVVKIVEGDIDNIMLYEFNNVTEV